MGVLRQNADRRRQLTSALARNDPGLLTKSDPPNRLRAEHFLRVHRAPGDRVDGHSCWMQGTCAPPARMISTPAFLARGQTCSLGGSFYPSTSGSFLASAEGN